MISHISGKVIHKNEKYVIVETGQIGYKVFAPFETIEKTILDSTISLWTYLAIRENAQDLYGFEKKDELDFFELLISISGIGPKTALNIINVASVDALKKAVSSGDTSHLIKVSGIGKKNAEKIVLELKGKFGDEEGENNFKEEVDALEALKSLGYSHKDARDALKSVSEKAISTSDRIKEALKILGR